LIVVANVGNVTIENIKIADTLPLSIDYISEDHSEMPVLSFLQIGRLVSWTGNLSLGSNQTFTITLTGKTTPCYSGMVADKTWVYAGNSCGGIEKQTNTSFILSPYSLKIVKTIVQDKIGPNKPLTYRIDVINTSMMTLTEMIIADTIPAGFEYSSEEHPAGLLFLKNGRLLSWSGNSMGFFPLMTYSVTISGVVSPQCRGKVANTAWVVAANSCGSIQAVYIANFDASYEGSIRVFPNPFRPERAVDGILKFEGVPAGGKIRIYSVDGLLIWEGTSSGVVTGWNGRDTGGGRVSKGLYIWAVKKNGSVKSGKLILD